MAASASAASAADDRRRNLSTAGEAPRRTGKSTVDADGTRVLISVGRAILARFMFIVHSLVTIWHTTTIER
ncbi:hypothetical protein TELCIR_22197, partial [Teladorsagia circumcincta]